MPYLGVLGSHFERPLSYLKLAPSNLTYRKIWCKKTKFLNLGPKKLDFYILGLELQNIIVIFKTSNLQFVLLQSLMQKQKSSDLGPKMIWVFLDWKSKIILPYLKSAPSVKK